ncbi:hypothetical protein ABVK25_004451 [Lepraria finkii]|uniref:Uncharacterized protein n=1 Tax=Lepraria finkii TaxID=1340010 RepID=A0ABR4BCF8_9LECA
MNDADFFQVASYLSSSLESAAPATTAPQVNAAQVLKDDVEAANLCQYINPCQQIHARISVTPALVPILSCNGIRLILPSSISETTFNDLLNTLFNEGTISLGDSSAIVSH